MAPSEEEIEVLIGERSTKNSWLNKEKKKYNNFKKSYLLKNRNENEDEDDVEKYLLSEFIRQTHAERVRWYINKDWKDKILYKNIDIKDEVASICYSHCQGVDYVREKIRDISFIGDSFSCLKFVSVVLRLADIMDFDMSRAPKILMEQLDIKDKKSREEWRKHQAIRACTISGNKVICAAKCEHPRIEYTIRKFCDLIEQELKNATYILATMNTDVMEEELAFYKRIQLPVSVNRTQICPKLDEDGEYLYKYCETQFTLNKKQITDLLMGSKLYNSPSVALRELVQNSLDACRLRQKICESNGQKYGPKIIIRYKDTDNGTVLSVEDNGIGMNQSIIDNYYTNIGNSYYKSDEYYKLLASHNIEFSPISRFGIGILSCFMVADEMEIKTKRLSNGETMDDGLSVTIEGYDSIFVIRKISKNEPGTETILKLKEDEPWKGMTMDEFVECVTSTLKNPPFPIEIYYKEESKFIYENRSANIEHDMERIRRGWGVTPNISKIDFVIDVPEYGFKGKASISYITKNKVPVDYIETHVDNVLIQNKNYKIAATYAYDEYGIYKTIDSLTLDENNQIIALPQTGTNMESYADISLRGISIPRNLFIDFKSIERKTVIHFPLPTLLVLDIYDKTELTLNTARTDVIYDENWKLFEERIVLTLCQNLKNRLTNSRWKIMKNIIIDKMIDDDMKKVVENMRID